MLFRSLRDRCLGIGKQQFRPVGYDSAIFLAGSRQEAWHIHEGNDGNIEAVAEALVLSKKAGLDPNTVYEAIRGGLAGSTVMDAKAPMMIEGNFKPGFRIKLHQKDLHNAILTGKELGVPLPVTSLIQQMIGSLMNDGKEDSDHSAIANFLEQMAGLTISGD